MNIFVVEAVQPLMFRQHVMLLKGFTSVSANWPGSVHDSRIWKNSDVGALTANSRTDDLSLGDEGYGIAPWLMTPYKEPLNAPQERSYSNCLNMLKKGCLIIGRCFGQLKRHFPILQGL